MPGKGGVFQQGERNKNNLFKTIVQFQEVQTLNNIASGK